MIQIHLDPNHISVQGHAPRPENVAPGQNIVCAAVSALTLTLIEGLRAIADMEISATEKPGDVRIEWTALNEIGKALVDTWFLGIVRIQDSYSNTILII